jgi:hypothetical protein
VKGQKLGTAGRMKRRMTTVIPAVASSMASVSSIPFLYSQSVVQLSFTSKYTSCLKQGLAQVSEFEKPAGHLHHSLNSDEVSPPFDEAGVSKKPEQDERNKKKKYRGLVVGHPPDVLQSFLYGCLAKSIKICNLLICYDFFSFEQKQSQLIMFA